MAFSKVNRGYGLRFLPYLALYLLLLLALPTRAALQFDVFLGYDSLLPQSSWFPITCELFNDGPSFNATIEVSSDQLGQGMTRRLQVELPTNTRKRVFIPVFSSNRYGSWRVRLIDDRGKVRAEETPSYMRNRKAVRSDLPMVAALCRIATGLPVFPEVQFANGQPFQHQAARMQTDMLPDNPLLLEGVDLFYLNSQKAQELKPSQAEAILAWLQRGGHLIIGVEQGADIGATPWLRQLMPCELGPTTVVNSQDALEGWVHAPVQNAPVQPPPSTRNRAGRAINKATNSLSEVTNDTSLLTLEMPVTRATLQTGKVLIGTPELPLAIQAAHHRGQITVLLFSPEREPFLSWKNRQWFWVKLAGISVSVYESTDFNNARLGTDGIFGSIIDSKQVRKLPLGWLLLLLVAYLVVIGPLDRYWLKKINRQMLTWITFPLYVVAFSALIYFIGFRLRAGDLEWNELNIVDVLPNGESAVLRGQTYASIYSPLNAQYQLAADQPFAALRGEAMDQWSGSQEASRAELTQRGNSFDAEAFVPVWTSQLYVSDWFQPAETLLKTEVTAQGNQWTVQVDNNTGRTLTKAHLAVAGRIYELGNLAPNKTTTFTLDPARGTLLQDFVNRHGQGFRAAVQARRRSFGENRIHVQDPVLGAMAASFVSQLHVSGNAWDAFSPLAGLDLSQSIERGQSVLLAWDADHSFAKPLNRFSARRVHRNTLLRVTAPATRSAAQ